MTEESVKALAGASGDARTSDQCHASYQRGALLQNQSGRPAARNVDGVAADRRGRCRFDPALRSRKGMCWCFAMSSAERPNLSDANSIPATDTEGNASRVFRDRAGADHAGHQHGRPQSSLRQRYRLRHQEYADGAAQEHERDHRRACRRSTGAPASSIRTIRDLLEIVSSLASTSIVNATLAQEAQLAAVARAVGDLGHDIKNALTPIETMVETTVQAFIVPMFEEMDALAASWQEIRSGKGPGCCWRRRNCCATGIPKCRAPFRTAAPTFARW